MKKLLAVAPFFLLLAACANNPLTSVNSSSNTQVNNFTCEDNGKVTAVYSANGQVANLNVTLPKLGLDNKKVTLSEAVAGSGARYTNDSDPKMSYDWHTKSDYGVMSVRMANGQEYSVNCQL